MASSSSENQEPTSYTKMNQGDVEAIGAHCQMEYCHVLDLLPFKCLSCKKMYCLDHRTETAHKCPHEGAAAKARTGINSNITLKEKPSIYNHDKQCRAPACKTLIDTPASPSVECRECRRHFCLAHRFQDQHACAGPPVVAPTPREKGIAALDRFKAWGLKKKESLPSTSNISIRPKTNKTPAKPGIAQINTLKTTAKGDAKIPADKRVYLYVEASADTTTAKFPTGKFYYGKDWSIGRVLDAAAKALQVQNVNNRVEGEQEKLRVFHVEQGRLLEYSEKVGEVLITGNTIVLLRGVGPAVPDLITV